MSDAIQEEELPHDLLHKLLSIEIEINKNLIEPQECNNFDTTIKIKSEKQMNIAKKEVVSLKQLIWKSNLQLHQLDSINGVQLFALVTPYFELCIACIPLVVGSSTLSVWSDTDKRSLDNKT
jgi:hypothetical protein